MENNIKDLLISIVKVLIDNPDRIEINELHSEQSLIFELKVDNADLGKVIGRGGRTAQAIRTILESACGKLKKRCILEILE